VIPEAAAGAADRLFAGLEALLAAEAKDRVRLVIRRRKRLHTGQRLRRKERADLALVSFEVDLIHVQKQPVPEENISVHLKPVRKNGKKNAPGFPVGVAPRK
jgi:hypothetical protein